MKDPARSHEPERGIVDKPPATIGVVVKGWPRLSETFIAQELHALERRGFALRIHSLRLPTDSKVHDVARSVAAPVRYLPEYLWREPARVLRGWVTARRHDGYRAARRIWLRDLIRDPTPNRIRRFGQALVLAAEMADDVRHLYAHFLHTPASVARYAALIRGLTWSVSAHAKDIWTSPEWEKREKLESADWTVTCTRAGRDHLAGLTSRPDDVELVYHGIDESRMPPYAGERPRRDGSKPTDPVVLLSVGRAVPKKGYDDLLVALAALPPSLSWRFVHIGGGPLLPSLKRQTAKLRLSARITWRGAQTEDVIRNAYREADLFVLASRITPDGDRDGVPNVLLEAMSQRCPVVATAVSSIPELIADGVTGLLAPPAQPQALAAALHRLIVDPDLRGRLGRAGEIRVRRDFPLERGVDRIAARLASSLAASASLSERRCALRSTPP